MYVSIDLSKYSLNKSVEVIINIYTHFSIVKSRVMKTIYVLLQLNLLVIVSMTNTYHKANILKKETHYYGNGNDQQ